MVRALYSFLTWLIQPLLRRKLARRAVAEPGYAVAIEERFGHYTVPPDQGRVWIHAVSLGETRAAAILLAQLREQMPGLRLLLTNGTATGRAEGEKLLRPGDVQVWQPWDTPGAVARFLDQFRPGIGILMETEVWPNLTAACAARAPRVQSSATPVSAACSPTARCRASSLGPSSSMSPSRNRPRPAPHQPAAARCGGWTWRRFPTPTCCPRCWQPPWVLRWTVGAIPWPPSPQRCLKATPWSCSTTSNTCWAPSLKGAPSS